jgi:hypothetical protein
VAASGGSRTALTQTALHQRATPAGERRHRSHRRRGGLRGDEAAILDLQRLAGNAAVTAALTRLRGGGNRVATVDHATVDLKPAAPPGGLRSIRDRVGGRGVLGLTIRAIEDSPPLFRAETPTQAKGGWTTKARPVGKPPEPMLEELWPTQGRHKIADGTYLEVEPTWEDKLKLGEDEHASDAQLAVELTWKKVAATINALAKQPGPPAPSADAAVEALWKRYVKALPDEHLRPEGAKPSDAAQKDVLAVRGGTYFGWVWESTVVRDTRGYHEPRPKPKVTKGPDVVNVIDAAGSKIPGPSSADLLAELRAKYTPGRKIIGSKLP